MKYLKVNSNFIKKSLEMAIDLHGLADMQGNVELRRDLKKHINQATKYLRKIDE